MPYLLTDGYILTMDNCRTIHPSGFVLTNEAGRIEAVGPMTACPDAADAERIDCAGRFVLPGLIDSLHVHWQHLFPGMGADAALADRLDAGGHRLAAQLAGRALAAGGVTTALFEMPASLDAATVRGIIDTISRQGVQAIAAVAPALAADVLGALVGVVADPESLTKGRISEASIRDGFRTARDLSRRVLLRVAPQGTDALEQIGAERRAGRSTVYHLMEMGLLDQTCLLVCPPVLDDLDRSLIEESGCHVIGLPLADGMRGTGSGAFSALARAGVPCVLGSDGPGFAWSSDMLEQIKVAVMAQNTLLLDPNAMSFERALEMATVNSVSALGLDTQTGALAPGLRADIAVFDATQPHQLVSAKPLSAFLATTRATEAAVVLTAGLRQAPPKALDLAAARTARSAALVGADQRVDA